MSNEKQKDWSKIVDDEEELQEFEAEQEIDENLKLEHPSYELLEEKLTKAEQEANKYREDFLRAMAENENTKRRLMRDVENAHKYSLEKFVSGLLPVADSLEMAIAKIKEHKLRGFEKILEGNELTLKLLLDVFGKFGIEVLDPTNKPFDPSYHQAMSTQVTNEVKPDHVIHVMQKGYLLNGRLVRPALVVVSKETE